MILKQEIFIQNNKMLLKKCLYYIKNQNKMYFKINL